jgi:hypothetical protein
VSRQRVPMDPREGRSRMWQAMRVLRTFTVADMEATAEVSRASATHYVRALRDAGYVQRLPGKRIGQAAQFMSYRLVQNTGPHAPRVSHGGKVLDMNDESAKRQATVTIPKAEYERALRCVHLCESIRAYGAGANVKQCAAAALEVAR